MAERRSEEVRAQVIAEWKAGSSESSLAHRYGVSRSTVQRWIASEERAPKTKSMAAYDLDAMALRLIDGSVSTLGAIHGTGQKEAWLERQNANDLAIFYGVISDKLIRVLGAIKRPDNVGAE